MQSIQVEVLSKSFGELTVLKDFQITFNRERIHGLFGPSGCGKTTLLQLIAGLLSPDAGQVQGVNNRRISYVFQEDRLLPWATVKENIMFVLAGRHKSKTEAKRLCDRYLSLVELTEFENYFPDQLSGGMRQRVALARAFAYQGEVLLLDEPFKGLDYKLKQSMMEHILAYWQEEKPLCLFVSHDPDEVLFLADVIHMFGGPPLTKLHELVIDLPRAERTGQAPQLALYKKRLLAGPAANRS